MTTNPFSAKIVMLDSVLAELRSLGFVEAETLRRDWLTKRAIERDLQLLVEIAVDICQKIITQAGYRAASTGGDAVRQCIKMRVLTDDPRHYAMVGVGNLVFHRHEAIDPEALAAIVNTQLADFEQFRAEVVAYAQST